MSLLVVLGVLVALALTAPFLGEDTRWPGAGKQADRPQRGKRYRHSWNAAIAEEVRRQDFGRTT
ncbi:hypothetical protein [Kineococcus sp. SYSU DK003]|uniref:hypothetical protein n=1 Tax=Kineococcus sp. SYSU DK003 TaxID=3383124 RepID=UPI003D7CFC9B